MSNFCAIPKKPAQINPNRFRLLSLKEVWIYDSDVEEGFAKSFELNEDIKVYAKLPPWFTIDTPLGSYNLDWAVLVEMDGAERLYFVVETKGSLFTDALRPTEQAKIDCGREHFKALNTEVGFAVVNSFKSFSDHFA